MGKQSPKKRKDTQSAHERRSQHKASEERDPKSIVKWGLIGMAILFIFTLSQVVALTVNYYPMSQQLFEWIQFCIFLGVGFAAFYAYWMYQEDKVYLPLVIATVLYLAICVPLVWMM